MFMPGRGLIGPYGGTPESESQRPVKLTWRSVLTIFGMLLIVFVAWVIVGNFLGPAIVIAASLLIRKEPPQGKVVSPAAKFILDLFYFVGVILTMYCIFIGGLPIEWQAVDGEMVVRWVTSQPELVADFTVAPDNQVWMTTDEWGTGLGELPGVERGMQLFMRSGSPDITVPLWVDSFRWIIVATLFGTEFLLAVLLSRQITETLLPSLPNSVRAKPGLLARLFPFLTIKNVEERQPPQGAQEEEESAIPVEAERAPMRQ